jgi:putrescine:ornithine antiporter
VQEAKKMTLVQLTFIVAVNMMGSGIIMLPTNMASVGAISLLSWLVTAVGSMAIAYGFAQAGIFNQRSGGMSAYAEDAYGKSGYFIVFFLYFLSLAIGNVAIAISAVGYLASFLPWLSSTPIATTIGVIGLLWLTTVANFGGPGVTGKIGSITVWGVILPVGLLSVIGWFWFKSDTFAAAWNPQGLSLGQGMGSSIALTLWAFLGMESAAQNSSAVENPKRDVPLACLFGTLGAAVIYILSTTVIQGIVPNADLADSTGPFGLAYARMFNPTIGSIVMALAVLACLGSLLGWQFTIAMTGKSAADERMFPTFFTRLNGMGAPVTGMIVMGVVQSLMALSTISPSLSEQFGVLVNLAVVTNVIPYIIALSALPLMMQRAGVDRKKYRMNIVVAVIAMGYSTFAIYASGKDAVLGGTIVMAVGFIVWGFLASRFATGKAAPAAASGAVKAAVLVAALTLFGPVPEALAQAGRAAQPPAAGRPGTTLDRIRETGVIRLGFRADARPFSFRDEQGNAAGYSVELCQAVADRIKAEPGLESATVVWVPVEAADRFRAIQQGRIDLLCGADTETLARRAEASFSIPVFPGGIGALLRTDAPTRLKDLLSGRAPAAQPNWRATGIQLLQTQRFAVVKGTTAESWLAGRFREFRITASRVVPVDRYEAGIQALVDRRADVFFGDRAILLDAAHRHPAADRLMVLERLFTTEREALAFARGDDDLRLLVDRTLSGLYASGAITATWSRWFGLPGDNVMTFLRWNTLPE